MKKLYYILVVFFISVFSSSALADGYAKGRMRPLEYERLINPVSLSTLCKNVKIVEWRSTPGYTEYTKLDKKTIRIVNATCNLTVKNFYTFIDSKKVYYIDREKQLSTSLSFIPAVLGRSGKAHRNLNDVQYRFAYRSVLEPLWGYFQRHANWAYITNDVLEDDGEINVGFVLVTAHELFHAMSYTTGVFHQHKPVHRKEEIEEELAEQFTEFLGLGRSR